MPSVIIKARVGRKSRCYAERPGKYLPSASFLVFSLIEVKGADLKQVCRNYTFLLFVILT